MHGHGFMVSVALLCDTASVSMLCHTGSVINSGKGTPAGAPADAFIIYRCKRRDGFRMYEPNQHNAMRYRVLPIDCFPSAAALTKRLRQQATTKARTGKYTVLLTSEWMEQRRRSVHRYRSVRSDHRCSCGAQGHFSA